MALVRLAPSTGKGAFADEQNNAITRGDKNIAATMERLFDTFSSGDMISVAELDGAKPSNRGGIQITGVVERFNVITKEVGGKEKNILMISLLVHQSVSTAVTHVKAGPKENDVHYVNDDQALIVVYKRYLMTPADRAEAAKHEKLHDNRKHGDVPHGLVSVQKHSTIRMSIFGASEPIFNDAPITPGAVVKLDGVTFSREYEDGALSRINVRAASCIVERSDLKNAERLRAAQHEATAYPPLWKWGTGVELPSWPDTLVLSRAMEPAADPMVTDADGDVVRGPTRSQLLAMPDKPTVELLNMNEFYLHMGENKQEATVRAQRSGVLSTPTVVCNPVVSRAKDAIEAKIDDVDFVRGTVHIVLRQAGTGPGDSEQHTSQIVLSLTNQKKVKVNHIEMLTGVKGFGMQRLVIRSMLVAMRGPISIQIKEQTPYDHDTDAMRGATVFTAYCTGVSPSVLPQTVPRAGFRVSRKFAMIWHALMLTQTRIQTLQTYGDTAYTYSTGAPSETSEAIALRVSATFGVFGDGSNNQLLNILAKYPDDDEAREKAVSEVIHKVKGGLAKLGEDAWDFYAVGWIVPTDEVIQDQTYRRDDPDLISANEAMISTGIGPTAIYKAAIKASERNGVPKEWSFYAIRRTDTEKKSLKRLIDAPSPGKRAAAEDTVTGKPVAGDFEDDDDDVEDIDE